MITKNSGRKGAALSTKGASGQNPGLKKKKTQKIQKGNPGSEQITKRMRPKFRASTTQIVSYKYTVHE